MLNNQASLLLALAMLLIPQFLQAFNETEPNGSFANANLISQDSSINGSLGGIDNDDYFISVPQEDGTLELIHNYNNNSGTSNADLFLYIYNKGGNLIGNNYLYNLPLGSGSDTIKVYCRERDTIYIRLRSTYNFSYDFTYTTISSGVKDLEPNGSFSQATSFNPTDTMKGRISYQSVVGDNDDYFYSVLPDDGTIKCYLEYNNTSNSTNADFFAYIYNKNGSLIGNSYLYDRALGVGHDTITVHCRAQDTVYFRISSSAGCFSYSFRYEMIPSGQADLEPNGSLAQGNLAPANDTTYGRIGYRSIAIDNDDYFLGVLPTFGTLKFYVWYRNTSGSSNSDFFSSIYNKSGSLIGNSYQYDQATDSLLVDTITIHCRELDSVYFKLGSSGCFSYKFYYEVFAPTSNDTEPNGSFAEAKAFNQQDTVDGRIRYTSVTADDNDYFYSVLPEDGTLKYYLEYHNSSGSTSADFFSYIYNKNGNLIGNSYLYDRALGVGHDTITVHCRAQDTVYFRISSSAGCFSYRFHYEVIPSGQSDPEPNNDFNNAVGFTPQDTVSGRISYQSVSGDDNDYFYSILPDDGAIKYYLEYNNTSGSTSADFFSYIYNKNGNLIGNSYLYDRALGVGHDTITVHCRAQDTVYFRISSSAGCFSYRFHYEVIPSGQSDPEPNNSSSESIPISLNDTLRGRTGYTHISTDSEDYFHFFNPGYASITAQFVAANTSSSSNADLFLYLYNSNGNLVFSRYYYNQSPGPIFDTLLMDCLPRDTFSLRVSSSAGCFSYQFNFEVDDQQPLGQIEASRMGNKFAFISLTHNVDSVFWDFGDGTTDELFHPKKEFGIGSFDIAFEAFNSKCNISTTDSMHVEVAGIESYRPREAATDEMIGSFNLRIFGGGFDTNATVSLRKGSITLTPERLKVPASDEMNLLFSFSGAEFGLYDLEISLSNGDKFRFPGGFKISKDEPGIELETTVVGPTRIRTNRWTDYTLNITNKRKRIANGVVACIVLPRDVETNIKDILFERSGSIAMKGKTWDMLTIDPEDFNQVYFDGEFDPALDTFTVNLDEIYSYSQDSLAYLDIDNLYEQPYKGRLYSLYIPMIGGNSTYEVHFKLKSPTNQIMDVTSYTWPFTFRRNPLSADALWWIHEAGMQTAAAAEYAPHPGLKAVGKSAAYVDVGSQILFTEYFDWYYGVNNADESFYAQQGMSLAAEYAGGKTPYGKNVNRAENKISTTRRSIRNTTENIQITRQTLRNGRLDPGMRNRLLNDLSEMNKALSKFDRRLSFAEKQKIINETREYFSKRGIDLTNKFLQKQLFGEDDKTNKPDKIEKNTVESITSFDPNAIYGTQGPTKYNYIRNNKKLYYEVAFENVDTAKAPAQIVRIELQLDTSLVSLSSVQLGDVGFGGQTYFLESERHSYFRDIDLRPEKDMIVRVNAHLDTVSGKMLWQFTSLEPGTGKLLSDPDAGFLPPNQNAPEGEGNVFFGLELKPGLSHRDSLVLHADIYFDENEPITTNNWRNTIDKEAPVSNVLSGEVVNDTIMILNLEATDAESGVREYRLHARVNGKWINQDGFPISADGPAEITGSIGNTYEFYVESMDSVANKEEKPEEAELRIELIPSESNIQPDFRIFPNPSTGLVLIRSNGNFLNTNLIISDVYGRVVHESKEDYFKGMDKEVSLGNLSAGAYFFYFENSRGQSSSQKLILLNQE